MSPDGSYFANYGVGSAGEGVRGPRMKWFIGVRGGGVCGRRGHAHFSPLDPGLGLGAHRRRGGLGGVGRPLEEEGAKGSVHVRPRLFPRRRSAIESVKRRPRSAPAYRASGPVCHLSGSWSRQSLAEATACHSRPAWTWGSLVTALCLSPSSL